MNWVDKATEIISQFFNQDVTKIIVSALCVLVILISVISKTSIGKKALRKLSELHTKANAKMDIIHKEYEEFKKEKEEQIEKIKIEYESKLAIAYQKHNEIQTFVLKCLEHINNEQVRTEIQTFISQSHNEVENISSVVKAKVEEVSKDYETIIKELTAKYEEQITELKSQIETIKNEVENYVRETREQYEQQLQELKQQHQVTK